MESVSWRDQGRVIDLVERGVRKVEEGDGIWEVKKVWRSGQQVSLSHVLFLHRKTLGVALLYYI